MSRHGIQERAGPTQARGEGLNSWKLVEGGPDSSWAPTWRERRFPETFPRTYWVEIWAAGRL